MFFESPSGLTISKILKGISKSLGIIKEFSPIYNDLKPLVKKIPYLKDALVSFTNRKNTPQNPSKNTSNTNLANQNNTITNQTGPVFFQ